jgi:hypothetical protein
MKSVSWPKPGYVSIICSTISYIPYNLIFTTKFNDSSILFTIIPCDYLNLSLADEHVGDVTIPTQVIEYNQNLLQADLPIRLKYSNQIKLYRIKHCFLEKLSIYKLRQLTHKHNFLKTQCLILILGHRVCFRR